MKNISTGTGIALLAGAIVAYPIIDRVMPRAEAGATQVAAVVAAATAQVPPTVVWMGVCEGHGYGGFVYHRLWSDGRQEFRHVPVTYPYNGCAYELFPLGCPSQNWIEVPPPPSGNGFACRADLDGNRTVDGADLGMILANWGQQPPCEPEATFPCMTIPGGTLAPLVP